MASESLEDSDDEDHTSPQPVQRPAKRRKVVSSDYGTDADSTGEGDFFAASGTSAQDLHATEKNDNEDGENAKPKSKYKIHIPKNSELPSDAFFTQPPQRSSSPYRIDQFHWHKPRKPSPPSINIQREGPKQHTPRNPHVNTISTRQDQVEERVLFQPQEREEADDDFGLDESYEDVLAYLPSDAFSSPNGLSKVASREPIFISSQQEYPSQPLQNHRLAAPLANLRQTTLFGTQVQGVPSQTQSSRKHNWPMANREETPTHHKLDREALATWVYPINLGTIRDYQYSIVARGLYHNMLVALPTGLGKTFIAATIMLNWFRWTTESQIVFVAPTKPLVSQQVKACFDIAGIPRSATTMLTGGISPGLRAEEWQNKRVFFMTPQTIINDLKTGICDPKRLVLLVVDEAHRATGGYAYVEVVNFLKRFNSSFRVLALTATPGASIEKVQEVIDGLGISRVEIRTEESIDIRQYVHSRKIETILFENSDEMVMVMELFSRALQPVLDKLTGMNAYWARDPMTLTPFGCNQARTRWMSSDAGRKANMGVKGMVNTIFSLLASLSHGTELLKFHGIGPFYHKVLAFRNEIHSDGKKGGKYAKQINEAEPFQTMMSRVQIWINNPDFIGHPKLEYLQSVVMNHFLDAGDGRGASDPSSTRVMVFSHYRDSAEEIARVLKRNDPMIRPHVFVGQANSKGSDGMDQKKQLDVIKKFQTGIYNTLVATSIGEEGLDIGEVDLIVCYDASASPIRMLQRMGRTGRKRAGNIVVTLMKGKEEDNFIKAKDNYQKMQKEIASGTRFNFHDEESRRIVPRDIVPVVDKKIVEIPPENTQADLPEPTKRGRKPPKRPAKKFHMPDGVRTGFVKASRMGEDEDKEGVRPTRVPAKNGRPSVPSPEPLPSLEEVLLTPAQEREFERRYLDIKGDAPQIVEVPRVDAFPDLQRSLRPTKHLGHGHVTKRAVSMLKAIHNISPHAHEWYKENLHSQDEEVGRVQAETRALHFRSSPADEPSSQSSCGSKHSILETTRRISPAKRRQNAMPRNASLTLSSTNELASDDSLNDFLNDDMGEDIDLDIASSKSSPPSLQKGDIQFNEPGEVLVHSDADSDDGLPDFGTLVQKGGSIRSVALSKRSNEQLRHETLQRRGRRKVVQDDSEDE
ncbi:hypothetical protein HO173_001796 [Letharia columbiana]|uniref:ATP-dependent DNA helicase n=1 Tax=Letharia columbiana TaxID=112416 RepID=A0A8H6G463_9LECA|nr:uncharacterized protein HO173_001796 [Letharia columbiana]KAF6240186.1 hypothetical protein HO173_001796 [Letharia columbiana]